MKRDKSESEAKRAAFGTRFEQQSTARLCARARTVVSSCHDILAIVHLRFRDTNMIILLPFLLFIIINVVEMPIPSPSVPLKEKLYVLLIEEGNIGVVDPEAGMLRRRIQVGSRPMYLAYDKAQNKVYVSNTGSTKVSVVDIKSEKVARVLDMPVETPDVNIGVIAYHENSHRLYVAELTPQSVASVVYVIDTQSDQIVGKITAGAQIVSMTVSQDGGKIFVLSMRERVEVYSASSLSQIATMENPVRPKTIPTLSNQKKKPKGLMLPPTLMNRITCHPTKDLLYMTLENHPEIFVFNTQTYVVEMVIHSHESYKGDPTELYCSSDGAYVFIVNHKTDAKGINCVMLIPTEKNDIVKIFNTGFVLNGLSCSLDGKMFYTAGTDINIYDLTTYALLRSVHFQTTLAGMTAVSE